MKLYTKPKIKWDLAEQVAKFDRYLFFYHELFTCVFLNCGNRDIELPILNHDNGQYVKAIESYCQQLIIDNTEGLELYCDIEHYKDCEYLEVKINQGFTV